MPARTYASPRCRLPQLSPWGGAVAIAASVIPATFGLDALRQLLFPGTAQGAQAILLQFGGIVFDAQTELLFLLLFCVVFLILARLSLGYLELLAKREGRLTSRHQ